MALTTDKLDQSVSSELPGNPPLWIARRDASSYQYDLYVNDARVILGDIKAMSTRQDEQVRIYLEYTHTYTINWAELHRWAPPDWIWENASCDLLLPQNDHFLFHQLQLKQFQIGNSPIVLFISFLSPGRRDWIFSQYNKTNETLMCLENLRLLYCILSKFQNQVLHVIDKVLEPILTSARDPQLSNPDAARLLERAGSFNLGPYQIRWFFFKNNPFKSLFFHFNIILTFWNILATLSSKSRRTRSCRCLPRLDATLFWFRSIADSRWLIFDFWFSSPVICFWPVSHGSDLRSSGKRHRDNARQTGARLRPSIKQPAAADRLTSWIVGSITHSLQLQGFIFGCNYFLYYCLLSLYFIYFFPSSALNFYCPVTYQFSMFQKTKRFLGCVEDSYFLAFHPPLLCVGRVTWQDRPQSDWRTHRAQCGSVHPPSHQRTARTNLGLFRQPESQRFLQ